MNPMAIWLLPFCFGVLSMVLWDILPLLRAPFWARLCIITLVCMFGQAIQGRML